jgi:Domain of unknown function (DUF4913)
MSLDDVVEQLRLRLSAAEKQQFVLEVRVGEIGRSADRTAKALDELENVLTDLSETTSDTADALTSAMTERQAQLEPPQGTAQTPAPDMAELYGWVEEHVAPLVRKTTTTGEGGGIRWCRAWWKHPEAVTRLGALSMAYAELSRDKSGLWLSVYLRDHLDPHLAILTSPVGPFHACNPRSHNVTVQPLGQVESE